MAQSALSTEILLPIALWIPPPLHLNSAQNLLLQSTLPEDSAYKYKPCLVLVFLLSMILHLSLSVLCMPLEKGDYLSSETTLPHCGHYSVLKDILKCIHFQV